MLCVVFIFVGEFLLKLIKILVEVNNVIVVIIVVFDIVSFKILESLMNKFFE